MIFVCNKHHLIDSTQTCCADSNWMLFCIFFSFGSFSFQSISLHFKPMFMHLLKFSFHNSMDTRLFWQKKLYMLLQRKYDNGLYHRRGFSTNSVLKLLGSDIDMSVNLSITNELFFIGFWNAFENWHEFLVVEISSESSVFTIAWKWMIKQLNSIECC